MHAGLIFENFTSASILHIASSVPPMFTAFTLLYSYVRVYAYLFCTDSLLVRTIVNISFNFYGVAITNVSVCLL